MIILILAIVYIAAVVLAVMAEDNTVQKLVCRGVYIGILLLSTFLIGFKALIVGLILLVAIQLAMGKFKMPDFGKTFSSVKDTFKSKKEEPEPKGDDNGTER